jgi:antimicrobial peptide system SdpB family protein
LAAGLGLTLACNDAAVLFDPVLLDRMAVSTSPVDFANLFVLLRGELVLARAAALATMLLVVLGLWPRLTCALHAWVAVSFAAASRIVDGGDHIHAVLAVLLLPLAWTDARRWHWHAADSSMKFDSTAQRARVFIAQSTLFMLRLQMAFVYFHASIGKMAVREWANGTAVYYWFTDPAVGAPPALLAMLQPLLQSAPGVMLLTWGTMAFELGLVFAPLLSRRVRWTALGLGICFHFGIILIHGLVSFFFSMCAGLVLLLVRPEELNGALSRLTSAAQRTVHGSASSIRAARDAQQTR